MSPLARLAMDGRAMEKGGFAGIDDKGECEFIHTFSVVSWI